jgi:ubiquinone/menaquinone biosynthesis C-methylase UbiE
MKHWDLLTTALMDPLDGTAPVAVQQSQITFAGGGTYPIVQNVLRFVEENREYTEHWNANRFQKPSKIKIRQAKDFIGWASSLGRSWSQNRLIVDAGCGDGNHLPLYPSGSTVVAVDYSRSIDIVAARFRESSSIFPLQADITKMPLRDTVADCVVAYGSLNCTGLIEKALREIVRVLKPGGTAYIWAYGTRSEVMRKLLAFDRLVYRNIPHSARRSYRALHFPVLGLIRNSTGMHLLNSSLAELDEIISTNLAPSALEVLSVPGCWDRYLSEIHNAEVIGHYHVPCGVAIRRLDR